MGSVLALALSFPSYSAITIESTCYGRKNNGHLENGVQLPLKGKNFSPYSTLASHLGRTYVHTQVHTVVVGAYHALELAAPGKIFVYGETGSKLGGRFQPHRTHQNGLSVDFMVPVLDENGRSTPLPASVVNRFGYDIEFDRDGRYMKYTIDFEAIAEHLYQLHIAATAKGIALSQVIFDPEYLPRLFQTRRGTFLREHLSFMQGKAWVRHDEHYHVDFAVTCKPL